VYLAGAALWHPTPFAVIGWLGGVSVAVLVGLLLVQRPERPGGVLRLKPASTGPDGGEATSGGGRGSIR
jgi:hypothetical protein